MAISWIIYTFDLAFEFLMDVFGAGDVFMTAVVGVNIIREK